MRELYAPEWPIRFKNVSGSTIPEFGLMQCTGATFVGNTFRLQMDTPDGQGEEAYFVNGPSTVDDTKYGSCRSVHDAPFWVAYDKTLTMTVGGGCGPADGVFIAHPSATGSTAKRGEGFTVLYDDQQWTSSNGSYYRVYVQPRAQGFTWEGELAASLSAASDGLTGAATVQVTLWVRNGQTNQLQTGGTVYAVNRSITLVGSSGDYVAGIIVNGEYRILSIDCQ